MNVEQASTKRKICRFLEDKKLFYLCKVSNIKIMKKLLFITALSFFIALASCKQSNTDPPDPKPVFPLADSLEVIRSAVQDKIGQPVSSLSVYIQTPDRTIFATCNHPDETPLTANTFFRFASFLAMYEAGWKAREMLGYPGKPE